MFVTNEERIVKSLETIAECMVKSNEMAKEALKKSYELYETNMTMIKENTKTTNTETLFKNEELLKSELEKEAEEMIPY